MFESLILSTRVHTELFTALGTGNGNRLQGGSDANGFRCEDRKDHSS